MSSSRIVTRYALSHWYIYLFGAAMLGTHTVLNTYIPKQTGVIIDMFTEKAPRADILALIWPLVAVVFFSFACYWLWAYCLISMCRGIDRDLRYGMFSHLQLLSPDYYIKNNTGDLITRSIVDIQAVRAFFGNHIVTLIDLIATIIIALIFMKNAAGWKITLICAAPSPLLLFLLFFLRKYMRIRFRRVQQAASDIGARVQENVTGIRVLKAFAQERAENERFDKLSRKKWKAEMSSAQLTASMRPMIRLVFAIAFCAYLILGGRLVIDGRLSIGEYTAFNGYLMLILSPMSRCGSIIQAWQHCRVSMKRLDEVFSTQPSVDDSRASDVPLAMPPALSVHDLSYRYPDTDHDVLRRVSFDLQPGELLSVMGPTGCGKTTLTNLIERLWETPEGHIFLGGRELHSIPLKTLRTTIAFVPQDTLLFSDTVANNIRFRNFSITQEEIEAAAKLSAVHESIVTFPEGYETMVGERGVTLSGGQKQRIAIARAAVTKPAVLIMDDSLSAVDTETEAEILRNLKNDRGGCSVMLITHRISAAMLSDKVLFLAEDGSVEAYGHHDELLNTSPAYRHLFESASGITVEGGESNG